MNRALEENGMRPATCPSELVMFSCHQTPAQPSEFRADDTAVLCDDGTHDTSRFWVSKSPPKKSRYPHLEHPLLHGRVDLKEIIQSGMAVCNGFPK